jgi:hypothetical protein
MSAWIRPVLRLALMRPAVVLVVGMVRMVGLAGVLHVPLVMPGRDPMHVMAAKRLLVTQAASALARIVGVGCGKGAKA